LKFVRRLEQNTGLVVVSETVNGELAVVREIGEENEFFEMSQKDR
jgi:hypothetical protein